jgi:hypothetical protein
VTSVALADMALGLCSQLVQFARRPLLFKTNDPRIVGHALDFFRDGCDAECLPSASCATITIHVRESDEPCEDAPWFRARGHFAFARFTRGDAFWFNLRTREIYGACTPELAGDSWRWRVHIFPTLLGILSAVIGVAPVHAACLVRNNRGVLLTGHSGVGKSTLAIALARRGYTFLSDEWTYLSATGSEVAAWGLPVPVKLLPDTIRFFPELLQYRATLSLNGEIAHEVDPDQCFGISLRARCTPRAIVLLERGPGAECQIAPISAADAIDHLAREIEPLKGLLASGYKEQIELIHRLKNAVCFRVTVDGHPNQVAKALDMALSVMR